ncbi:MAG TPA: PAS domain S-box protein, partial [Bacteroidota bacterium]|nr:PAS domain S-box protein [Bacteroidota bacterium]
MSLDKNVSRNKLTIMKIVSIYALFGGLWIYTSDSLLVSITHNPLLISKLSVLKGFVFISLTALLLYSLIARMVSQLKTTEDSLHTTKNLYRLISENSADVIWLMDIETQYFTYVSPSVERLRGYTVEEVMRQPVELALTPESYHRIAELLPLRLKAFLAGDERARINITEIEQPCKDGSIVPTEVVTTLLTNADHTVTTILGVSRNISERKQFEKSLHQSMEQYRMLFKNNPMPLWVYDRKTLAFLDVNDAAVHRYGYSAEEFRSMTLKDIRPAEEIPKLLKSVSHDKQLMRETGIWKHRKKDGTLIDVEITVHDIDYYGVPARLVLAEDVTAWKQAEEALQESAEKMRLLIEGNRDFFFYTQDTNATITYISPSIEKITGYSVDQWIGQKHWFASDSPINDFAREKTRLHL